MHLAIAEEQSSTASASAQPDGTQASNAPPLDTIPVQEIAKDAPASDPVELQKVTVVAKANSHLAGKNRTGTRSDADPMTLPMTISNVSKEQMAEQQNTNLRDAVLNVAGVSESNDDGTFQMRGFTAGVLRNGDTDILGQEPELPIIALENVEVVKGPEGVISGVAVGYGGVINLITKAPQPTPVTEFISALGSHGYYEVGADIGRPVNASKSVLVRMVAAKQGSGINEVGYKGSNQLYLAPSLTLRSKTFGTDFTVAYEYQKHRRAPSTQIFTTDYHLSDDEYTVALGPEDNGIEKTGKVTTLAINQKLWRGTQLTLKYTLNDTDKDDSTGLSFLAEGLTPPQPANTTGTIQTLAHSETSAKSAKAELHSDFSTGPIEHKLLLAVDQNVTAIYSLANQSAFTTTNQETGERQDMTTVYGSQFNIPSSFSARLKPLERGVLLLDHLFWGKWAVLGGARFVSYELGDVDAVLNNSPTSLAGVMAVATNLQTGLQDPSQLGAPSSSQSVVIKLGSLKKVLPNIGIVYRATPQLSIYTSGSGGLTPNLGYYNTSGENVPPENALQYEAGVKYALADRGVALSGSVYQIRQKNVAVATTETTSADCNNQICYGTVPGVVSTGAEIEISGELFDHIGYRAGYGYNTKKTDNPDVLGILYAPHVGNLYAIYRFGNVVNQGFRVSIGMQARSGVKGGTDGYADNPGRTRWDMNGGYQTKGWSLVAGLKNLFDKRQYTTGSGVFRGGAVLQPREWYATLRAYF